MPAMTESTRLEFLQQPHVRVLATLKKNLTPYNVPVWWLFDETDGNDGVFWLAGTADGDSEPCLVPVAGHIGIDGVAQACQLPDFDISPLSRRLAEKYIGRGDSNNDAAVEKFFANMQSEPRMLFRIQPENWRAIDMREYRGKKSDRDYQKKLTEKPTPLLFGEFFRQ